MRLDANMRCGREGERGSALTLSAISLVVLLAMAGLAIDLAMLYVARSEAQRSADAAAMTGAQGIGQAGYPSVSQAVAEAFAAKQAAAVGNQNLVAGISPRLDPTKYSTCGGGDTVPAGEDICFDFSNPTDPRVSVVVQRTAARSNAIPLFFMRIFGISTADVSASAIAEFFPAANRLCLKPWLLANCDPYHTFSVTGGGGGGSGKGKGKGGGGGGGGSPSLPPEVNPNCPITDASGNVVAYADYFIHNGSVVNPAPAGSTFVAACGKALSVTTTNKNGTGVVGECLTIKPGNPAGSGAPSQYYPVQLPSGGVTPSCPSCQAPGTLGGAAAYEQNIACCNLNTGVVSCGLQKLTMKTGDMVGPTSQGVDCLIHESGGSGQDSIFFAQATPGPSLPPNWDCPTPNTSSGLLYYVCGGSANPYGLKGLSGLSSSDSMITVPIYDGGTLCPGVGSGGGGGAAGTCVTGQIQIDGYLTLFIKTETNPQGTVYAYVVGVHGCGAVPTSTQITVRLIHN